MFVRNVIYIDWYLNMILKLIAGVIFVLVVERTLVLGTDETASNEIDTEDDNKPEKLTSNAENSSSDADESSNTLNSLEDATQNITHQGRISYHTKRGAPRYYTTIHRARIHSHRGRPSHSKSRKKYRRSRRKPYSFSPPTIISAGPPPSIISAGPPPSIISAGPPIISPGSPIISSGPPSGPSMMSGSLPSMSKPKSPFRQKPILLSELLRSSSLSKMPAPNRLAPRPVHEYVNENEFFGANSYPSTDAVESFPSSVNQFGRPPPSIEITGSDSLPPLSGIGEEIYPGVARPTYKRPGLSTGSELYSNKPPDIFLEDDAMDSIRNVRLANNAPNNYVDREILNLLQKMKQDGVSLESRPETTTSRNKVKETSAAISKLLTPFLSESSIKKIRSYLNLGLSGAKKKEKDTEKNVNNIVIVENPKHGDDKSISVTEPLSKDDAQYFIMLKQKNNKTASAAVGVQTLKNRAKGEAGDVTSTARPEAKTPISLQSLELQHYIMSLAGIGESGVKDYRSDDYLPRFSGFQNAMDQELLQSLKASPQNEKVK